MAEEDPEDKKKDSGKKEAKTDAKAGDDKVEVKPLADDKPAKDNKDHLSYVIDAMQSGPCEDRLNMTTS